MQAAGTGGSTYTSSSRGIRIRGRRALAGRQVPPPPSPLALPRRPAIVICRVCSRAAILWVISGCPSMAAMRVRARTSSRITSSGWRAEMLMGWVTAKQGRTTTSRTRQSTRMPVQPLGPAARASSSPPPAAEAAVASIRTTWELCKHQGRARWSLGRVAVACGFRGRVLSRGWVKMQSGVVLGCENRGGGGGRQFVVGISDLERPGGKPGCAPNTIAECVAPTGVGELGFLCVVLVNICGARYRHAWAPSRRSRWRRRRRQLP